MSKLANPEILLYACEVGNLSIVVRQLSLGADLLFCDFRGFTALHCAVQIVTAKTHKSTEDFLKKFVHRLTGDDADAEAGCTCDRVAAELYMKECDERIEIVRELAAAGACLDARDNWGRTPLHWAASAASDCPGLVFTLLDYGANRELRDSRGYRPRDLVPDDANEVYNALDGVA